MAFCDGRPLCRESVKDYMASMLAVNASSAKVCIEMAAIKLLARECLEYGLIPQSTAAGIIQIKGMPKQPRRTGRWLSEQQTRELLAVPQDLRGKAILSVMVACALRRAEVCSLTRGQFQMLDGRHVFSAVQCKRGKVRIIPMPAWAAMNVALLLREEPDSPPHWPLFHRAGAPEKPLSPNGLAWLVGNWSSKSGYPIACHDIRRTSSSMSYKNGASLTSVQSMLGHSSPTVTAKYLEPVLELNDCACDSVLKGGPQ